MTSAWVPAATPLVYIVGITLGYGNDSRQNGPFGLRESNSPLLEVNSKLRDAAAGS